MKTRINLRPRSFNRSLLRSLALATAAVALSWSASGHAIAQYRVDDQAGHTLDASNRLNSGGYNGPVNYNQSANSLVNSVYLGNSTGYSGFHGINPSRNLNQFTGQLPNQPSLQLLQQSGTYGPGAAPTYNQIQPYYTNQTATYAPPGFNQLVGGVYIPTPSQVQQPQDYRLGYISNSAAQHNFPNLGEVNGPGAVDPTANMTPTYLTNAPIYGARELDMEFSAANNPLTGNPDAAPGRLSADDIIKLRGELNQASTPWLNPSAQPQQPNAIQNATQSPAAAPNPFATPAVTAASAAPPNLNQEAAISSAPLPQSGDFSTGQSQRNGILPLPAPEQQSPEYAKLRKLLQEYQSAHPQTDEEANRLFQQALKARRQYEQNIGKASPTQLPTPGPTPVLPAMPNNNMLPATPPPPAPIEIGSIGHTVTASGLSQLIIQGEELARHQQYKDAIAKFLDARQVAPNNMLITVDLANAELGAGFYEQAAQYLRDAFSSDPATLMAQYDVKSVMGDQRFQVVIGDLKQIASSDNSSTPIFLLAYLSYNVGDKDKAVEYLKLAEGRAGGQDPLLQSLSDHWSLPATTQPSP